MTDIKATGIWAVSCAASGTPTSTPPRRWQPGVGQVVVLGAGMDQPTMFVWEAVTQ